MAPVRSAASIRLGDRLLKVGTTGRDVFHLQVLLDKRGARVPADGAFGPMTLAAVSRVQQSYRLTVDGVVGPVTLVSLYDGGPPPCSSTPGPGDAVERWRPVVGCVLSYMHQSSIYVDDVLIVIRYESAGDPYAINGWDVNAQHGDPSRGLMQVIGAVFGAHRSPALANFIYDPAANIYAGLAYSIARYGSIYYIPGVRTVRAGRPYVPYKMAAR